MSLVVIFPIGADASADAYLSFVNDPANCPDAPFYDVRLDKYGRRVVGYLGPGGYSWNGSPFHEPVGGVEARAGGALSDNVDWPDPDIMTHSD